MHEGVPVLKDLVLVGGGHSHVIVLKGLGMTPMPGVRVTLIARDIDTPYSGMLPGLIAGHYDADDVHIDLGPLTRFAGARLYHDEAVGLDLSARQVICRGRPPVPYDVLSIDIGVTPRLAAAGAADHAVAVKPIATLVERWTALRARVRSHSGPVRIGVVGAGAAGVELTLAAQHVLRREASAGRGAAAPVFHLFGASATVLPTHNRRTQRAFTRVLEDRGIQLHLGARVSRVDGHGVATESGSTVELDEVLWATDAGAQAWPGTSGLDVDAAGFIRVDETLRSTSHPEVFAAGDIASVVGQPREKAGVFAVRQGPPLETNLRLALRGHPLEPFRPQRQFLSLISTGDRFAVASRGPWTVAGRWVWRWKDRIDRRFMERFRDFPEMDATAPGATPPDLTGLASPEVATALATPAMRCAGCGSKVGATLLDRVLARLTPVQHDDVVTGLGTPDDASVESVPDGMLAVRTIDAFPAIVDDPYTFGRIAAHHALSDIFAMGAEPRTALALATIPHAPDDKMEQLLGDLLTGAVEVLNDAGAALVGGHTKEGGEVELGLALSGVASPDQLLRKGGLRPGDRLLLTKPLGTGTLFAADMRGRARGRWVDAAIRMMLVSNAAGARVARAHGATACTDVTGFGLLGHLLEMIRASGVGARVDVDAVPLLDGALETARRGWLSSLQPDNVRVRRAVAEHDQARRHDVYPLLFDPQTSGGLLFGVPADRASVCLEQLRAAGYDRAAQVGEVVPAEAVEADQPLHVTVTPDRA